MRDALKNRSIKYVFFGICRGSAKWRIALMCAEKEPLDCHRTILLARHLADRGARVGHILADGAVEPHTETIKRLWLQLGMEDKDFFDSEDDIAARAYELQERRIVRTAVEYTNVETRRHRK